MTDSLLSSQKSLGDGGGGGDGCARGTKFLVNEDQKLVICLVSVILVNLGFGIHANVKQNQVFSTGIKCAMRQRVHERLESAKKRQTATPIHVFWGNLGWRV